MDIIEQKNTQLRQSNAITEARYDISPLEKNILYLLISQLNANDEVGKHYLIDVKSIRMEKTPTFQELEQATYNLISRVYEIKKPNGNILMVSLMTMANYDGGDYLKVAISQNILPYFVDLKENFTEFELYAALSLKNKYAKRLYEMLCQHKSKGILKLSIEDLKWRLSLIDKKGKEVYPKWSQLEVNVIKPAVLELRKRIKLPVNYEIIKRGKKYTHISFKFIFQPKQLSLFD